MALIPQVVLPTTPFVRVVCDVVNSATTSDIQVQRDGVNITVPRITPLSVGYPAVEFNLSGALVLPGEYRCSVQRHGVAGSQLSQPSTLVLARGEDMFFFLCPVGRKAKDTPVKFSRCFRLPHRL